MCWGTKSNNFSIHGEHKIYVSSASARLGAAATFDGPTNALLSSRNANQLPGKSRNRSTFFQKQELALFRSHWQACIFYYVLFPAPSVLLSLIF